MKKIAIAIVIVLFLQSCRVFLFGWSESMSNLKTAEEFSRQGNYAAAIEAYREHMNERLKIANRPEWENPYFYQILIGDIQLGQDDPESALSSYLTADKEGVDSFLVADRIRSIAQWYEQRGQLQKAIDLLHQHRERDSLLFDSMLDRYARELVKQEEIKKLR